VTRSARAQRKVNALLLGPRGWPRRRHSADVLARLRAAGVPMAGGHVLSQLEPVFGRPAALSPGVGDRPAGMLSPDLVAEGPLGSVELAWRATREPGLPPVVQGTSDRKRQTRPGASTVTDARASVPLWKRLAQVLKPSPELLLSSDGPIEWAAPLFPYQLDGVRALLARDALLLADDLGLGKTVQAIAALRILLLQHQVDAGLVIVPAGLVDQWRQALRRWAPELRFSTVRGSAHERAWQWRTPAHVYLTSYDTLREDLAPNNPQAAPRQRTWDVVVIDEAQRIKNRETRTSRACKALFRRRAWALTGTPLENSLDELASVLEFVMPHRGPGRGERLFPGPDLLARHQALQLRRRKRDVLPHLPPKINAQLVVTLGPDQRATYEHAEREGVYELREQGEQVRIENVLALITRLKQICNFDPVSGQSAKLADMRERLSTLSAEGHRALVFSQFTDATFGARALAARLTDFQPIVYTGDIAPPQRDALVQTFKADPAHQVMILSLRAGGLGLNLQDASYVFHFDRWWNPAVERQAEDRSHRLGQTYPVHVYAYVCADTIEERIASLLQRKQELFDELIDDVSLDLTTVLTHDELFGLFGLAGTGAARS
jgi:SNF2 family DNA or RNA helicase